MTADGKFLIDVLGVTIEMLLLYYFYGALCRKNDYPVYVFVLSYFCIWLIDLGLSSLATTAMIKTIGAFVFSLLAACLYQTQWHNKVILAAYLTFVQVGVEIMVWAIFSLGANALGTTYHTHPIEDYFWSVLLSKFVVFILLYATLLFVKVTAKDETPQHALLFLALPITSTIIIYQLAELTRREQSEIFYYLFVVSAFLLVLVNLIVIWLFNNLTKMNRLEQQAALQKVYFAQQQEYYVGLIEKNKEIRQFRHDLRNHIAMMHNLLQEGQSAELAVYLNGMQAQVITKQRYNTANPVLDTVLNLKAEQALAQETTLDLEVYVLASCRLDAMDIVVVLSNCLDNALEAVAKLSDTQQRIITGALRINDRFLSLQLSNPIAEDIHQDASGKLMTTKKDKQLHGLGLANVESIAQKYDGEVVTQIDKQDQRFTISLTLKNRAISTEF